MAAPRLGVVTFGHSGGTELGADLSASLPGCDVIEEGLLDDVTEASLRSWQAGPASAEGTVVHLRDGRELTIESAPLLALVGPALVRLAVSRPQVVLYGCAGPLPDYPLLGGVAAVHPRRVLLDFVTATVPHGKVGVLVPAPLQIEATGRSYRAPGREVDARSVSPEDRQAVLAAAAMLGADGAQLVVLGCFDYTLSDLRAARAATSCPVTSSRQLAIGAVRDLLARPVGPGAAAVPPGPRLPPGNMSTSLSNGEGFGNSKEMKLTQKGNERA
ncbi:MAG TPA: AroM family protein [Trebonia sp.]|nr:AroM family protein [Trebonia sp.]